MPFSVSSLPDPFGLAGEFVDTSGNVMAGYTARTGKTPVSIHTLAGLTKGVKLLLGQSTTGNWGDTIYTTANPTKALALSIYDGGLYPATDPIIGANGGGGSWSGSLADKLIAAGKYQSVIICNIGVGTTSVANWDTNGALRARIRVAKERIAGLGLTVTGVLWQQGELDAANATTQAAYQASLNSVITYVRAIGIAAPFFVAKCSFPYSWTGSPPTTPGAAANAIRAAQAGVLSAPSSILAGPDVDTLTGTANRQASGTDAHMTGAGSVANAELWKTTLVAAL